MPPVKPICKSSKSCNKLPLELKSGGKVWNAKDGVVNIGSRSCQEDAIQLVRDYPDNVYLELTSLPGRAGVIETLVRGAGSERILFGTDLPWFDEYQLSSGILDQTQ